MSYLPGMSGVHGMLGAAPVTLSTISLFDSAISGAATLTLPSGLQNGDVGVLIDAAFNAGSLPTKVVPSGYTELQSAGASEIRGVISAKILTAAESGSSITGMDGTSNDRKIFLVFRGNVPIAGFSAAGLNAEETTGNPAAQNISSGAGAAPLVAIAAYRVADGTSAVPTPTMSPTETGTVNGSNVNSLVKYLIYNSSPANVSVDMGDGGVRNLLQSLYLQFT